MNWEETNAGLGHLVHFFAFLLEKFKGFKFRKVDTFEINGSYSKLKGRFGDSIETYEMLIIKIYLKIIIKFLDMAHLQVSLN